MKNDGSRKYFCPRCKSQDLYHVTNGHAHGEVVCRNCWHVYGNAAELKEIAQNDSTHEPCSLRYKIV